MRHWHTVLAGMATAAALAWAAPAFAATLYFDVPATVSAGDGFTLTVLVDTKNKGFNAAEATLAFPTNVLEVTSIDTAPASTAFNFWISLPSFSNDKGTVRFSGGATHGLVGSAIQVLAIHMRAKGSGDATITASDASVNASDGSGTNILDTVVARRITVRAAKIVPASQTEPPGASEPAPSIQPTSDQSTEAKDTCAALFGNCIVQFPIITNISVTHLGDFRANVSVSGTAPEGEYVRLKLTRGGIRYKEIETIVEPDQQWEGVFTNLYGYGVYQVEAMAVTDAGKTSEPVIRGGIHYDPPYTISLFDFTFRWYFIASVLLGLLVLASALFLAWQFIHARTRSSWLLRSLWPSLSLFALCAALFVGMVLWSYALWKGEYVNRSINWKDTDIECTDLSRVWSDELSSAKLEVYIDGIPQAIPEGIGISPTCVAQIHTHDDTGHLHFLSLPTRPIRLGDFFTVADTTLQQTGYTVDVTVNGEAFTDRIDSYVLRGDDTIVVKYTSKKKR